MKRNLLWIAACLLSAAMLVACNGDNGKQPETQDTTSAETVTEAEVDSTDADTAGESETVAETETLGESELETTAEESTDPETTTVAETEPEGYSLSIAGVDISEFKIVTAPSVQLGHQEAIDDFISWIYKATGERLAKVTAETSVEHAIYIIPRNQSKNFIKKAITEIENDGYVYMVKDGDLYISSTTGRGLYYGIYDFLEKYVGVRFYSEDFTHLREIDAVNLEEGMKEVFSPQFYARWVWTESIVSHYDSYFYQSKNNVKIWNLNVGDTTDLRTTANHTIGQLMGDLRNRLPDGHCLPCMTDEEIYQKVLQSVLAQAADPNLSAVPVGQEDCWEFCRCDNCLNYIYEHGVIANSYGSVNYTSATYLNFLNRLAEDVTKVYPDANIIGFAYFATHGVPANMTVHDNVIITFCLDGACYQHALDDPNCEKNRNVAAELRGWAALCKNDNLYVRDYGWNWNYNYEEYRFNSCMIDPNYYTLWDNFQFYLELGVGGFLNEGIPSSSGDMDHLRYYLDSHLMWNPSMTEDEFYTLMNEFLEDYYGDAASFMKGYIDELYSDTRMTNCTRWNFQNDLYFSGYAEALLMYNKYFDKALELDTLTAQQRIHVEYASMHLIRYICDFTDAPSNVKDQLTALWNEYKTRHTLLPWGY